MKFKIILVWLNEKSSKIVYINDVPSFILGNDESKDPIFPDGWQLYIKNKNEVDEWLKLKKATVFNADGTIFLT